MLRNLIIAVLQLTYITLIYLYYLSTGKIVQFRFANLSIRKQHCVGTNLFELFRNRRRISETHAVYAREFNRTV